MGGHPSSGFSYPSNIPLNYNKDLLVSYEVISSLAALPIGVDFNLSITAPISELSIMFPEIEFTQVRYDLYKARRFVFLGETTRCCITNENFYMVQGSILTCAAALKTPSTNRSCDIVLSDYCFSNPVNTHICKNWLEGYIQDRGYDSFTSQGYQFCSTTDQRSNNKFCDAYLTVMRANPDNTVHDSFIERVRDTTFRCSFPLKTTLAKAKGTNLPRVCWDPQCISSPLWKLKFVDYVTRLNCNVSSSNINFQLSDPNTLKYITYQSDLEQFASFKQIAPSENIYTQPLKDVGKIFFDSFSIVAMICLSILICL